MTIVLVGFLLVIGDAVVIKLFDDFIRPRMYAKAIANTAMISGLLCIIVGMIKIFTN